MTTMFLFFDLLTVSATNFRLSSRTVLWGQFHCPVLAMVTPSWVTHRWRQSWILDHSSAEMFSDKLSSWPTVAGDIRRSSGVQKDFHWFTEQPRRSFLHYNQQMEKTRSKRCCWWSVSLLTFQEKRIILITNKMIRSNKCWLLVFCS